jgi:hypothetical protein
MAVQGMKAFMQTALDEGQWRHSWMLTTLVDPYARERFAGSEEEMEIVAAYHKVMDDLSDKTSLARNTPANRGGEEDEEQAAPRQLSDVEKKRRIEQSKKDRERKEAAAKEQRG